TAAALTVPVPYRPCEGNSCGGLSTAACNQLCAWNRARGSLFNSGTPHL
ncbi:hypothetical protein HaLaN_14931, partial [Haematococcus lacustris]